jgi:AraC-like DNA-binding protein
VKLTVHLPPPPLSAYVEVIWLVDASGGPREKVLPNGAVELILNLGQPHYVVDGDRRVMYRNAWIAGVQQQPILIEPVLDTKLIGVRFRPGGLQPFVRFNVSELTDRVVDCDLLFGREFDECVAAGFSRPSSSGRPKPAPTLIEELLLRRLRPRPDPLVAYALDAIARTKGRLRVGTLAREAGVSERHLADRFERAVGVAPKFLARVARLQNVIGLVRGRTDIHWGRVAADAGYYDQSHLIREFRLLAGTTPSSYLRQRDANENHLIVG